MCYATSQNSSESKMEYNVMRDLCAKNMLCSGDHASWHPPLESSESRMEYNVMCHLCAENVLCSGDHVSWHTPLDGSESRVQHMLMTEDAQLQPITTAFGIVNFIQVKTLKNLAISCCIHLLLLGSNWQHIQWNENYFLLTFPLGTISLVHPLLHLGWGGGGLKGRELCCCWEYW